VNVVTAFAMWQSRDEIDREQAKVPDTPADSVATTPTGGNPFQPSNFVNQWHKTKIHSPAIALAVLNLLFLIMSLGLPWWEVDTGASYGLVQNFDRIPSGDALRKGGDPAFAFTFLAFLTQIHSTFAVTLRFLGRDDTFSAKVPHSLKACLISTGTTCVFAFIAFVIYAAITNSKNIHGGMLDGGFALIVLVWLMSGAIIFILVWKKGEVDNAPVVNAGDGSAPLPSTGYPAATASYPAPNPNPTFSPPVPVYGQQPPPMWGATIEAPAYQPPTGPSYTAGGGVETHHVPVEVLDEPTKI